jgi:tetratricopeptide (TPR) repeat protein
VNAAETRFIASGIIVVLITIAAVVWRRRFPGAAIAWAAFLVLILPMLGVVQNGPQIAADRYTYHASPALAVLAGAGVLLLLPRAPLLTRAGAALALVGFGALTWRQSEVWHDSRTFWTYVAGKDSTSAVAQTALGTLALGDQHVDDAIARYRRAIALDSTYFEAHDNLGVALSRQGRFAEAIEHFRRALALAPSKRETHNNLGVAAARLGRYDEALAEYAEAIELDPEYADAQTNWGNALVRLGRYDEAILHYREALRLQPANADAQLNWGVALASAGRMPEAIQHFQAALAANPSHAEARDYLEKAQRLVHPKDGRD